MRAKNVVVVVGEFSGFLQQRWVIALISRCMSARYLLCYANSIILAVCETSWRHFWVCFNTGLWKRRLQPMKLAAFLDVLLVGG